MSLSQQKILSPLARQEAAGFYALAFLGIATVGLVDYVTGIEVRVYPLYFVPLALAASRLGITGAIVSSTFASCAWLLAQYMGGLKYSSTGIWFFNTLVQLIGFVTVALLVTLFSERLKLEESLSRTDTLTGLLNRRGMMKYATYVIESCIKEGKEISIAYIDLDNFKNVNDKYGHAYGDEILKLCAGLIKNNLRENDIVSRLGGDEFSVIMPEISADSAVVFLENIRREFEKNEKLRDLHVSATIGVVMEDISKMEVEQILSRADAIMYEAKALGKNRVYRPNVKNL